MSVSASPQGVDLKTITSERARPRLRATLFGCMEATDAAGVSVLPRSRKTRALFALLALAECRPLQRRTIMNLLWSGRDRPQASGSLRQAVRELQLCLRPVGAGLLRADRASLALVSAGIWVDVLEVALATPARPEPLALLRGPLLEDLVGLDPAFDRWLKSERGRISAAACLVAEAMLKAHADPTARVAAAERVLAIDSVNEGAWRALIAAHAARGELGAAINTFDRCSAQLAEIEATPSAQTIALLQRIHPAPASPVARAGLGPLLGVMPLRPIGDEPSSSLSLGLAEEITTALSRFRWFACLSSASLATLAGEPIGDSERWQALGLDFLLDGTVQRSRDRVRINMRLLDMHASGQVVWARRFDRNAADILTLQDEIAAQTVAQLDPELLLREGERIRARSGGDHTAYELMLAAIPSIHRLDRSVFDHAGELLARSVKLDPGQAAAHAWSAYWHLFQVGQGWADNPSASVQRAGDLAERAVMLDPGDARALTFCGHVRGYLHQRAAEAKALHDRALSINPNLAMAWVFSGLAHSYLGDHGESITRISRARQLSPFDPHGFFFDMAMILPHMLRGEQEQAIAFGRSAAGMNPTFSSTYKGLLAALGHAGLADEASRVRERLLRLEPGFCIEAALARSALVRAEDRATYAAGLRRAGLPE